MSFRLFVYFCAAWGAAAALFGWGLSRLITNDETVGGGALRGLSLGLFLAPGLALLDAIASGSTRDKGKLLFRLGFALILGILGGLLGGLVGQGLYLLTDGKVAVLRAIGWALTGLLVGAASAAFDFLRAMTRGEQRQGARRKLRNGIIGGAAGGVLGGVTAELAAGLWAGVFKDADPLDLWSAGTSAFMILGASIGVVVALAQIVLREAALRVETGFRPGQAMLLTRPETTIGWADSCDMGLRGDSAVEKVHAKVVRQGDAWYLCDAGTPGGTLLNGNRIPGPALLHTGDRIQIGSTVMAFDTKTKEPEVLPVLEAAVQ
jgi:hypothetical protein